MISVFSVIKLKLCLPSRSHVAASSSQTDLCNIISHEKEINWLYLIQKPHVYFCSFKSCCSIGKEDYELAYKWILGRGRNATLRCRIVKITNTSRTRIVHHIFQLKLKLKLEDSCVETSNLIAVHCCGLALMQPHEPRRVLLGSRFMRVIPTLSSLVIISMVFILYSEINISSGNYNIDLWKDDNTTLY